MKNAEKVSVTMAREQMESGDFATTREAMRDTVRVRIRRSVNDPRPSLSADEAEAELTRFMESEAKGLPAFFSLGPCSRP